MDLGLNLNSVASGVLEDIALLPLSTPLVMALSVLENFGKLISSISSGLVLVVVDSKGFNIFLVFLNE